MAGPATNVATIGAVYRGLGRRVLVIYLGVVAVMSVLLGLTFDWILADGAGAGHAHHHAEGGLVGILSAAGLLAILAVLLIRRASRWNQRRGAGALTADLEYSVQGMTCGNCAAKVEGVVRSIEGVDGVEVFVDRALLRVSSRGDVDATIRRDVRAAGYEIMETKESN